MTRTVGALDTLFEDRDLGVRAGTARVGTGLVEAQAPGGGGGFVGTVGIGPDYGEHVDLAAGVGATFKALGVGPFDLSPGVAATFSHLAVGPFPQLAAGPAVQFASLDLGPFASPSVGVGVDGQLSISAVIADQDTWVGADAVCADNLNHDGTDLEFDGVLVQEKEALLGWDLSWLSGTITAATLDVQWKPNLLEITANDVDLYATADANEGWDEATVTCSTRPAAAGAALQTFGWSPSGLGVGVAQTVTLNSAVIARLNERIGVGHVTLILNLATANLLSREMESKDEGTDDALGPRLNLEIDL